MKNHGSPPRRIILLICTLIALPSCYKLAPIEDPDGDTDGDGDGDTDTNTDADTDTDADTGTDVDTDSDSDSDVDTQWISITGGTFDMGNENGDTDELPVHAVSVPDFEMMKAEVTVAVFEECASAGACGEEHWDTNSENSYCNFGSSERGDHPMNCVDWYGAVELCEWADGRLPTEAEWEYAARSEGEDREYPWGDEEATCDYAVMYVAGITSCVIHPTGAICSKPLGNTDQGLCDMAGNVEEWVEDDWHDDYTGAPTDGSAWVTGGVYRVLRGGSWLNGGGHNLRASARGGEHTAARSDQAGVRCARSSH